MTQSHVIGKSYEYRVRSWFIDKGWKAERNPLSGANEQIEEELGKHDIRCWRDDVKVFLQLECKKTNNEDNVLVIKKEWLDKIDFSNDEFLVFSYNRCKQHFAFMPEDVAEKVIEKLGLKKLQIYEASGESGFGFKREWLENKQDSIFICTFLEKTWYAFDLEAYVDAREKYKIETMANSISEMIKIINNIDDLKLLREKEEKNWGAKEYRLYYSKLERLESGEVSYNPDFIKEGQWWLSDDKKFDWNESTIKNLSSKVEIWVDKNLEEDEEGDIAWSHNSPIEDLQKEFIKILGLDKKK